MHANPPSRSRNERPRAAGAGRDRHWALLADRGWRTAGRHEPSATARHASRTELTPVLFLERSVLAYPDKVAVVHEGRRYTYRQLGERVNRLASSLRRAGLEKGDRVAFISPNTPALLEAHFGVPAAGGVLVAVDCRLAEDDTAEILRRASARFVFVDHEFEQLAATAGHARVVPIDDTGAPDDPYERLLADGSPRPVSSVVESEDEAICIDYTSRKAGRPEGAVYDYRAAYLNALGEVVDARLSPETVYLSTHPMSHRNGWCLPWAVTAVGGRHVLLRKVDPGRVWDLIAAEGVTHYNGAPILRGGFTTAMSERASG
jgi:fatty-acyl-CoA synthase